MPLVKLIDVAIPRNRSVKTFSGERVYIATGDLLGNQINLDSAEIVDFENKPSRASQETNPGDVIFAKMQATDKSIVINEDNMKHIYSSGFYILEPTTSILSQYLYHFLRSSSFHKQKDKNCSGATQKAITLEGLQNIKIPLPSLEEQKVIIAKLDKLIGLIDLKKEAIGKTEDLTKSVFQEMFIKGENFEEIKLGLLLEFLTSGSRGWAKYYSDSGDIFLRIQNVNKNKLLLEDVAFVKAPLTAEAKRTKVQSGDILLSITADLGRTAVIPNDFGNAFISQHLALLRLKKTVCNPLYISEYLSSEYGASQIQQANRGQVKAGLNFDDIKNLNIPLPPIEIQNHFAQIIQKKQPILDNQNQSLQKLQEIYNTTTQKIFIF